VGRYRTAFGPSVSRPSGSRRRCRATRSRLSSKNKNWDFQIAKNNKNLDGNFEPVNHTYLMATVLKYTAEHEFNEWKTVENPGFKKAP
jgi:hypothetical protein